MAGLSSGSAVFDYAWSGVGAVSGTRYLEANAGFTLNFSVPVSVFGFYAEDFENTTTPSTLTLYAADGSTLVMTRTVTAGDYGTSFWGVWDPNVQYVKAVFAPGGTGIGYDDFVVGTRAIPAAGGGVGAIPISEPAPALLFGFGLALTGGLMVLRKRGRQSPDRMVCLA